MCVCVALQLFVWVVHVNQQSDGHAPHHRREMEVFRLFLWSRLSVSVTPGLISRVEESGPPASWMGWSSRRCLVTCQTGWSWRQSANPQDTFSLFFLFLMCFLLNVFCQHVSCQVHISVLIPVIPAIFPSCSGPQ